MKGECDSCGNTAELYPSDTPHGEGSFCAECMGFDPEDDEEEEEEEPDFSCRTCGGSGGGPEHWACPVCCGTGTNHRAKRAYYDDLRADRDC